MGWVQGLEPWTFGTTTRRSSQLSYTHRVSTPSALDYYCSRLRKMQASFLTNFRGAKTPLRPSRLQATYFSPRFFQTALPDAYDSATPTAAPQQSSTTSVTIPDLPGTNS